MERKYPIPVDICLDRYKYTYILCINSTMINLCIVCEISVFVFMYLTNFIISIKRNRGSIIIEWYLYKTHKVTYWLFDSCWYNSCHVYLTGVRVWVTWVLVGEPDSFSDTVDELISGTRPGTDIGRNVNHLTDVVRNHPPNPCVNLPSV